jgi:hypothetical protein
MENDIKEVIDDQSTITKYVEERWRKYGQRFLDVCVKYNVNDLSR